MLWRMVNGNSLLLLHRFLQGLHVYFYVPDFVGIDICGPRSCAVAKKIMRMMNEFGGDYQQCFRLCVLEAVVGKVESRGVYIAPPRVTYNGPDVSSERVNFSSASDL